MNGVGILRIALGESCLVSFFFWAAGFFSVLLLLLQGFVWKVRLCFDVGGWFSEVLFSSLFCLLAGAHSSFFPTVQLLYCILGLLAF